MLTYSKIVSPVYNSTCSNLDSESCVLSRSFIINVSRCLVLARNLIIVKCNFMLTKLLQLSKYPSVKRPPEALIQINGPQRNWNV